MIRLLIFRWNPILMSIALLALISIGIQFANADEPEGSLIRWNQISGGLTGTTESGGSYAFSTGTNGIKVDLKPYTLITLQGATIRDMIVSKKLNTIVLRCVTPGSSGKGITGWNYSHLLIIQHDGHGWAIQEILTSSEMKGILGHEAWVRDLAGFDPVTGDLLFGLSEMRPGDDGKVKWSDVSWRIGSSKFQPVKERSE